MKVFRRVVDANGFSAAARELGISNAAVSKHISDLEAYLGAQLLVRTTRRMSVTEVGQDYYQRCLSILQNIEDADLAAGSASMAPRGKLRVNAPMSFGLLHVAPLVSEFLLKYQGIEIDLVLNDQVVDLVEGDFDVGIRIGSALKDSTLISKRLANIDRILCGSPSYFGKHGHPQSLEELDKHRCLIYSLSSSPGTWSFTKDGGFHAVEVTGPLTVNNSVALVEALTAGVGLSLIPTFIVEGKVQSGTLTQTLVDYRPTQQSLYAVYPQSKYVSQKVRLFIDFMADYFAVNSWSDRSR